MSSSCGDLYSRSNSEAMAGSVLVSVEGEV